MEAFLKELEQAVAGGYTVKILYFKSGEGQSEYRLIDPYRIIYHFPTENSYFHFVKGIAQK